MWLQVDIVKIVGVDNLYMNLARISSTGKYVILFAKKIEYGRLFVN
jgi:hypothetical protein